MKRIVKIISSCTLYLASMTMIFIEIMAIRYNQMGITGLTSSKYIFLFSSCYLVSVADLLLASVIHGKKLKLLRIFLFVHAIGGVLFATVFILLRVLHIF